MSWPRMMIKDGEGATKLASIIVKGAATRQDAFKAAEGHCPLPPLSKPPFMEKIPTGAESRRLPADPEPGWIRTKWICFLGMSFWWIKADGRARRLEKQAALIMKQDEISIVLDLNLGDGCDQFLFCDFSENYVKINADYRS